MLDKVFMPEGEREEALVMDNVGSFLKAVREGLQMTQHEVSDETGFTIQTISKIENGRTPSLRAVSLHELADYYRDVCDISENDFIALFYEYCDTRKVRGIVQ